MNADILCMEAIDRDPNLMIPWYLMASYLYYHKDQSLLSDELFDKLCWLMNDSWESLKHFNKWLISRDDLTVGTGYTIPDHKYPLRVKSAAILIFDENCRSCQTEI